MVKRAARHGSRRRTIADSYDPAFNSLNLLRLVLASLVIFSHAIVLGGFGSEAIIGHTTLGDLAVDGFFAISGFLVTASAMNRSIWRYLKGRVLRIMPGFWVCLVVTAALFGSLGWVHAHGGISGYLAAAAGPFSYIRTNFWLHMNDYAIAGTPKGIPVPLAWDASLWTLEWEFVCYLGLALLAVFGILRHRALVVVLFLASWALEGVVYFHPVAAVWSSYWVHMVRFVPIFLAGSLLYLYRAAIRDSVVIAVLCALVIAVGVHLGSPPAVLVFQGDFLVGVPFAYLCLWVGLHVPGKGFGVKNDFSYGVYIYAFPVQQLLVLWGATRFGYPAFVALSFAGTLPLAAASWWGVERWALALKRWEPLAPVTERLKGRVKERIEGVRPRKERPTAPALSDTTRSLSPTPLQSFEVSPDLVDGAPL